MEKKLSAWCKNAKIEMINRDLKTTTLAKHSKRHDNAVTCESTQRSDRRRDGSEIQRESCGGYF